MTPAPRFPHFYVVGAAKSGTTAVWNWLRQHPDVFLPAVKEPGFFAYAGTSAEPAAGPFDPDYTSRIATTEADYLALYDGAGPRLTGDVSPVYLIAEDAAARIAAVRPDARIVILLRDPVTRAFSQYMHNRRDGLEPIGCFDSAVAAEDRRAHSGWSWGHLYAANGHYRDQIARYLRAFPAEQILFMTYESLQSDPTACWEVLCDHLGLAPRAMPDNKRLNETGNLSGVPARPGVTRMIRHPGRVQALVKAALPQSFRARLRRALEGAPAALPELSAEARDMLALRYRSERADTERMTGLDLRGWTEA